MERLKYLEIITPSQFIHFPINLSNAKEQNDVLDIEPEIIDFWASIMQKWRETVYGQSIPSLQTEAEKIWFVEDQLLLRRHLIFRVFTCCSAFAYTQFSKTHYPNKIAIYLIFVLCRNIEILRVITWINKSCDGL